MKIYYLVPNLEDMWVIVLLLLLAVTFMLVELFLIPGFGITGVLSLLCMIIAIVMSYMNFSSTVGHIVMGMSLLSIVLVMCIGLKSGTWRRVSLQETITAKVNESQFDGIEIGDTAITISRLAPIGKVMIKNRQMEAKSIDSYIDASREVVVVDFGDLYLIVKQNK